MRFLPEKITGYFREQNKGLLLSLIVAVCLVYLPFLGNPFIFDDVIVLSEPFTNYYSHYGFVFDFRWFPYTTLGWTTRLFTDVYPQPYRIGNVLLHAANVIVVFFLLRDLATVVVRDPTRAQTVRSGALFGALIFAVHPVAVYAAGYVAQRSILMATLFALLAQWVYLRALLSGQVRWLMLAVVAFFLACFSKEHSIMVPAILAAMSILLRKENQLSPRALGLAWVGFALTVLTVVLRAKGALGVQVFGATYELFAGDMLKQQNIVETGASLHLLSILTQAGLFFKYLLLWLLPNPAWMSVDMREPFVHSMGSWFAWLGMAGFLLYGALSLWLLLRGGVAGLAGFALLYPWLQFFTEFASIRIQEPFVLYRSYLWMPGLMLLVPLLLLSFPRRRTLLVLACMSILLVPLAWNRLSVFGDKYRLWDDAASLLEHERVVGADRIFYNRAQALMTLHKWEEAAQDYERAVAMSPQLAPIHYQLGVAYMNSGRNLEALHEYDAAIAIKADDDKVYFAKGLTLKRLHRDKEALQQMELSCKLKNTSACMVVLVSEKGRNRK